MSYKVTFDQTRRTLPWKLDILANVAGRRLRYFYPTQGQAWSDAPRILENLQNGGLDGLEEMPECWRMGVEGEGASRTLR